MFVAFFFVYTAKYYTCILYRLYYELAYLYERVYCVLFVKRLENEDIPRHTSLRLNNTFIIIVSTNMFTHTVLKKKLFDQRFLKNGHIPWQVYNIQTREDGSS